MYQLHQTGSFRLGLPEDIGRFHCNRGRATKSNESIYAAELAIEAINVPNVSHSMVWTHFLAFLYHF